MNPSKYRVKFRPSGHSEDGVLIATFQDEKIAIKAAKKLEGDTKGKRAFFSFGDAQWGKMEETTEKLEGMGATVENYDSYQKLHAEITLPEGATPEGIALIYGPETGEVFALLSERSQRHKVIKCKLGEKHCFDYTGDRLCESGVDRFEFYFGWAKTAIVGKPWKIKIIEEY